ncbi:MAG: hypothetical protein Kow0077_15460 [Anaerolineae bacterium]
MLAAVGMTWPAVLHLNTHAIGAAYGDQFEVVRLIWWARQALAQGMHPAYQPLLNYPAGFFSSIVWSVPVIPFSALPLILVFSPLTAYNLLMLLSVVLNGVAGYVLCLTLTRQRSAALLGGLVVMAFSARQGHLAAGHFGLVTGYWGVLYVWTLVRLWRGAGWRTAALGGLFLGLAMGTSPTAIGYELLPLSVLLGGGYAWQARRQWRRWLGPLALLLAIGAAFAVFLYTPYFLAAIRGATGYLTETGAVRYSADLLAPLTPSPFNPVFNGLGLLPPWAWDVLGDNAIEGSAYWGVAVTILAILALVLRRADARLWAAIVVVGAVLALGPVLKVADSVVHLSGPGLTSGEIVLPYAVYARLPGMDMLRTPARFNFIVGLGLAVLAAFGWQALTARAGVLKRRGWRVGATVAVACLVLVEYQVFAPLPLTEAPVPDYYAELARDARNGVVRPVLNLPAQDFFTAQWLLYDQTAHHQPVIAGHVIRRTPTDPGLLALVDAAALGQTPQGAALDWRATERVGVLRATGAEIVVVYRQFGAGEVMAAELEGLLGPPVYTDARVVIFTLPEGPLPERPLALMAGGRADEADPARLWIDSETFTALYVPEQVQARPAWQIENWFARRWVTLAVYDGPQEAHFLPSAGMAPLAGRVTLAHALVEGFHSVLFQVPALEGGCVQVGDAPICRAVAVTALDVMEDGAPAIATFGEAMRLVRVAESPVEGGLELTMQWQALAERRADYTLFVHVVDASGDLVAQWDGPLGGRDLPTATWPANGVLTQQVQIEWGETPPPPGEYRLYAGLYTYPDLQRLPIQATAGEVSDNRLLIETLTLPASR